MKLLAFLRDVLTYSPEQATMERLRTISKLPEIHPAALSGSSECQHPRPVAANSSVGGCRQLRYLRHLLRRRRRVSMTRRPPAS